MPRFGTDSQIITSHANQFSLFSYRFPASCISFTVQNVVGQEVVSLPHDLQKLRTWFWFEARADLKKKRCNSMTSPGNRMWTALVCWGCIYRDERRTHKKKVTAKHDTTYSVFMDYILFKIAVDESERTNVFMYFVFWFRHHLLTRRVVVRVFSFSR